jgi:SAM-dependent methyltransferase
MHDFEAREQADQDRAAAAYNDLYHGYPIAEYWDEDFVRFVSDYWVEGDRVLDLGCGPGSLYPRWATLPKPSRLVGLDISPNMIEEARKSFPDQEFVVGRLHELPFDAGSFDIVVASSVLHHIPDDHLPAALTEIVRVLDEHGRVVGRDPVSGGWGQAPGWFSGSLMTFRHLVYRLTRSREYPEPPLGDHHHQFDDELLRRELEQQLRITRFEHRFPFSHLLLRVRDPRVANLATLLDAKLEGRRGQMIYYAGERNYVTTDELVGQIAQARDEVEPVSDAEFLAYLQVAGEELARIFGEPVSEPARPRPEPADRPGS